ncbi:MAG: hypothetical protein R6X08_09075 [Desulfosalsimonadaceae bacterium]
MEKQVQMQADPSEFYIACPYKKGQPRKHIAVCRKCRYQSRCSAYQDCIQPPLPLGWHSADKP